MVDFNKLKQAMGDLNEVAVKEILEQVMTEGGTDADKAMDACQRGMDIIGNNFESGEYYVADLIYAGELMKLAVSVLKDALIKGNNGAVKEKVILCTVKHDLHDIGKNIVKLMLEADGFEVNDLGIDVAPEKIVEEVKKTNIRIVGMSALLTHSIDSMKATVEELKDAGLRDKVKIIIGGASITENVCQMVGADAWALNPQIGVKTCREWATKA